MIVTISHHSGLDNEVRRATGSGSTMEQALIDAYRQISGAKILRARVLASTAQDRYAVRFTLQRYGTQPGARRNQGVVHTAVWDARVEAR
jgi:hypothetical protein